MYMFTYHSPTEIKKEIYEKVRERFFELSISVRNLTEPGREQSLALTKIEEAMFWANAAIARSE